MSYIPHRHKSDTTANLEVSTGSVDYYSQMNDIYTKEGGEFAGQVFKDVCRRPPIKLDELKMVGLQHSRWIAGSNKLIIIEMTSNADQIQTFVPFPNANISTRDNLSVDRAFWAVDTLN